MKCRLRNSGGYAGITELTMEYANHPAGAPEFDIVALDTYTGAVFLSGNDLNSHLGDYPAFGEDSNDVIFFRSEVEITDTTRNTARATIDDSTGAIIHEHVFQSDRDPSKRAVMIDTDPTPKQMLNGYTHVYTCFATPTRARVFNVRDTDTEHVIVFE